MAKTAKLQIPTPHNLSFITHNISLAAPYNGLHREAPPKRGYGRVGITLVEGVGNLPFEKVQQAILLGDSFYDCKVKKTLWFCDSLIF